VQKPDCDNLQKFIRQQLQWAIPSKQRFCLNPHSGWSGPEAVDVQGAARQLIYAYLNAVYGLVSWWAVEGKDVDRARRALCLRRLEVFDREDPFAAIIRSTADPAKVDKRTRSKWSRLMRYAAVYKPDTEALGQFIRRKGGINECAARYSERLGRLAGKEPGRDSANR
jgi:hypothetical protein